MVGAAHFSTMDFKSGFWQVKMVPDLQQYTAFTVVTLGSYEFMHMPFSLYNVPATFQHLMQNTLGELNLTYCFIYLDDMIVFGHTEKEHLEHLHIMFGVVSQVQLEVEAIQVFIFPIRYSIHGASCFYVMESAPAERS